MLFGSIKNALQNPDLPQNIREVLNYAKSHDLAAMPAGSHPIDGDRLFVNIIEYMTTTPENRFWEAHKDYLDIHIPILGKEQLDFNLISNMDLQPYQKEGDFLPMTGEKAASIIMEPGTYLVAWPEDAHRTAIQTEQPEPIKKAVFKVKI